jgi:hypothetical protein
MEQEPINPLQSSTIRAAIIAIVTNVLAIAAYFTGKVFDIELVRVLTEQGLIVLTAGVNIWFGWKAFKGRVNATQHIGGKLAEKIRSNATK